MNIHIKDNKEKKEKKENPAVADEKKTGSPGKKEAPSAKTSSPKKEDKKTEEQLKEQQKKNEELKKSEAELKNKLDEAEQKLKAVSGQYVRLQADFDNYRKRNAKLAITAEDQTTARILKDFLPVIDNLISL